MTPQTPAPDRSRSGSVAIEFALALPVLLTVLFGMVELTNALQVGRKLVSATQSVADLLTQEASVNDARLADIFTAAEQVVLPFPAAALKVGVASVRFDSVGGAPIVDWQASRRGGAVATPGARSAGLGLPGESVVIVDASYDYTPVFGAFVLGSLRFSETAVARPRRSPTIARN